jgi:hypothetical protein
VPLIPTDPVWFLTLFIIFYLATFRLARLVTTDQIFIPLRNKIWERFPPNTQFGYLFTCVWCTSIWTASLLVACYTILSTATLVFAIILALSTVAGWIGDH